jgi:hypothetical protein
MIVDWLKKVPLKVGCRANTRIIQVLDYVLEAFAAMRVRSQPGLVIFQISVSIFVGRSGLERCVGGTEFGIDAGESWL